MLFTPWCLNMNNTYKRILALGIVFVAVLSAVLSGCVGGGGGGAAPTPSPSPSPGATPTASPSPSPSPTPAAKEFHSIVKTDILQPVQVFLVLNYQHEPFNNPIVRKALAYATPYPTIIQIVYNNLVAQNWVVTPKGWPGYTEYNIEKYTYDINKAKQLLQQAGINPADYTIRIIYNSGNAAREKTATLLQNIWSQLGFKISVETYEWPVYLSKTEHGDYDVYIVGWVPDYLDTDNWVGPFLYGATEFHSVEVAVNPGSDYISTHMAAGNVVTLDNLLTAQRTNNSIYVIETDNAVLVIGAKGSGAQVSNLPSGKTVIVVTYDIDEKNTESVKALMEAGQGFGAINPAFFRDAHVDALVYAERQETDPAVREELFKALNILGNQFLPEIIIGQNYMARVYWDWVKGRYYHPTLAERYDLLTEDTQAPIVTIGIGEYKNGPDTLTISTIGWPESFDPAWTYETFGWEIWHEIGDTLVTFWKEETKEVVPDLAVAWAHSSDGLDYYFVIRGGVVAYDPWDNKTFPISALDVLFSYWRVHRLGHAVSWMVDTFMDVESSSALTEDEFNQLLASQPLKVEYKGQTGEVHSLQELLNFFGYTGDTAGVFHLRLKIPYGGILAIVADPFLSVVPMKYLLGDNYDAAVQASNNGKNPKAWEQFVQEGQDDPTHQLMHKKPVGTGPYYVKEYKENAYIVLERNPYYWNKDYWKKEFGYDVSKDNALEVGFHKYVIYIISDDANTRISHFKTGVADIAYVPQDRLDTVRGLTMKGKT